MQIKTKAKMNKKYLVIFLLFIAPILAYVFFASGVSNFMRLPVLTENVQDLENFNDLEGNRVSLDDKITILMFLGDDPITHQVSVYNLVHKIYKKNHSFYDFQFVTVLPNGSEAKIEPIIKEISMATEDMSDWHFAFGATQDIQRLFISLQVPFKLQEDWYSQYVYVIDRDLGLRGRNDDKDVEILYGYNAEDYAEINNKLGDDIKVLLAEYRLALKKNNRNEYLVQ